MFSVLSQPQSLVLKKQIRPSKDKNINPRKAMLVTPEGKPGPGTEGFAVHSPGDISMGLRGGGGQECCQQVPCTQQHRQGCPRPNGQDRLRAPLPSQGPVGDVVSKHLSVPLTARASAWLISLSKHFPAKLG